MGEEGDVTQDKYRLNHQSLVALLGEISVGSPKTGRPYMK